MIRPLPVSADTVLSLHQTARIWQKVLNISDYRLGQISHGAKAAARSAVIKKVANSSSWILFQEIVTGTVGFLHEQDKVKRRIHKNSFDLFSSTGFFRHEYLVIEEKIVGQMQNAIHMDDATNVVHVYVSHKAQNHHSLHQQLPVLRLRDVI